MLYIYMKLSFEMWKFFPRTTELKSLFSTFVLLSHVFHTHSQGIFFLDIFIQFLSKNWEVYFRCKVCYTGMKEFPF